MKKSEFKKYFEKELKRYIKEYEKFPTRHEFSKFNKEKINFKECSKTHGVGFLKLLNDFIKKNLSSYKKWLQSYIIHVN